MSPEIGDSGGPVTRVKVVIGGGDITSKWGGQGLRRGNVTLASDYRGRMLPIKGD